MFQVEPCELPQEALLRRYSNSHDNSHDGDRSYADCFSIHLNQAVSLQQFVHAFYTTPLFRVERTILGMIGRPSSDEQALSLSQGSADSFAAWSVEARSADQLLLCDFRERTRSWFMVADSERTSKPGTQLFLARPSCRPLGAAPGKVIWVNGLSCSSDFTGGTRRHCSNPRRRRSSEHRNNDAMSLR